jgi:hypothetical protein
MCHMSSHRASPMRGVILCMTLRFGLLQEVLDLH